MPDSDRGPAAGASSAANNSPSWAIRSYREGDIPAIVALINAVSDRYELAEGSSEKELRLQYDSPRSEPARQVVVAEGKGVAGLPHGMFVGYGRITYERSTVASERIYYPRIVVHPSVEGQGLARAIAERLIGIAREYESEGKLEPVGRVLVKAYTAEQMHEICDVWENAGLRKVRQYWVMARDLDVPVDEPAPIDGVDIRPYRYPQDNEPALAAYNDSFADHWDYQGTLQDDWDYWHSSPFFRRDLSWVAEVEGRPGEISGFCFCSIFPEDNKRRHVCEGWIELLGTTRAWRRKGLGRSLLLHGLHSLRSAGMNVALLGVDAASLTGAQHLYESVGFRVRTTDLQHEAALNEIR